MAAQIVWDDVTEGLEIGPVMRHPTSQQLVMYAGASGDYYQIHYDKDYAQGTGLQDIIIHGALKNAFLGSLVTDWMGPHGNLRRLSCQYRGMDIPGHPIAAKGVVTSKYEDDGVYLVDCEIWLENEEGQRTTPGRATVSLPKSLA
jgi:acyl dehydratase